MRFIHYWAQKSIGRNSRRSSSLRASWYAFSTLIRQWRILRFSYWIHFHPPLWFISCCRASAKRCALRYHHCTDDTQLCLLPSWPRHGCCQPQTMSGRNRFLEEGQLAAAQPGQGRNDTNQQGEMLWGPGEICNSSISWGHTSGEHPKSGAVQAPGQDSTFSQTPRKLTHFFVRCLLHFEIPNQLSFELDCENCTRSLDRYPRGPLLDGKPKRLQACYPMPGTSIIWHMVTWKDNSHF